MKKKYELVLIVLSTESKLLLIGFTRRYREKVFTKSGVKRYVDLFQQ